MSFPEQPCLGFPHIAAHQVEMLAAEDTIGLILARLSRCSLWGSNSPRPSVSEKGLLRKGDRMMTTRSCLAARGFVFVSVLGVLVASPAPAGATEHQLFLSVMNQYGQPVEDLRGEEVVIEHAGTACTIISVQPGTAPMKIALLVDNSEPARQSLNPLRAGLRGFLDTLPAQHEVELFTIANQARMLLDFTTDREALVEKAEGIFVERGGTLLLDGLVETWKRRFEDEDSWPVFVTVVYDGAEASNSVQQQEFNAFVNELRARAATVHAVLVSTRGGGLQADVSMNITKNTGGRYRALAAPTALPDVLTELSAAIGAHYDEVKNRYRTVYECEDDNPDRIQARVNRPAVAVRLFADRRTEP